MPASTLASSILGKIQSAVGKKGEDYGSDTASACQSAIADAISEYIKKNAIITVAYSGANPTTGAPDPLMSDVFEFTGAIDELGVPGSFSTWVESIQVKMLSGLTAKPEGKAGVTALIPAIFSQPLSISQAAVKQKADPSKDSSSDVWNVIAEAIFSYVNSITITGPIPAAHGVFTGAISSGVVSMT